MGMDFREYYAIISILERSVTFFDGLHQAKIWRRTMLNLTNQG